jgi:hypothetical protein
MTATPSPASGDSTRFQTRPLSVDAIRWVEGGADAVYAFIRRHRGETRYMSGAQGEAFYLFLYPRGEQPVRVGDWVVAGLGGLKGYSPEAFRQTFEEAPNDS